VRLSVDVQGRSVNICGGTDRYLNNRKYDLALNLQLPLALQKNPVYVLSKVATLHGPCSAPFLCVVDGKEKTYFCR